MTTVSSTQSNALYSAGLIVGIISFSAGLAILAFMEFLKLSLEHDSISVTPTNEPVTVNPDLIEKFGAPVVYDNNNSDVELRPTETIHDDNNRQRILEEHADSRRQWQQQQQQLQVQQQAVEPASKSKKALPTKLMAAVAQRNAAHEKQHGHKHKHEVHVHDLEDEDDDDDDLDDHSGDDDSLYSFPSAFSDASND